MTNYKVPVLDNFSWQFPVLGKDLSAPPGGESKGQRYLVATGASAGWAGQSGNIALCTGTGPTTWEFVTATAGMQVYVADEDSFYVYTTSWIKTFKVAIAGLTLTTPTLVNPTIKGLAALSSLTIGDDTTSGGYANVIFKSHYGGTTPNSWKFEATHTNIGLFDVTAGKWIWQATAAQNVNLNNGNLVIVTAGKGIDFSADANAAGMTSELLDDYEEGTWTPALSFGGGTTGLTYTVQYGYYTKVGNLVTVTGYIYVNSKGSSTGAAIITGLPFTIVNNDAGNSAPSLNFNKISFVGQYAGYGDKNTATVKLIETTEAGVISWIDDTNFSALSEIIFSFTYRSV